MLPFTPPVAPEAANPEAEYRARLAHFTVLHEEFIRRGDRQGMLNVIGFFTALAAMALGFFGGVHGWYVLAALAFVVFVASFVYHARLDEQRRRYRELVFMQEEALARLRRDWAHMPLPAYPDLPDPAHVARDLDLIGHASLLHLLGMARTSAGLATVREWVTAPASHAEAGARQAIVRALAAMPDFRDALALEARLMGHTERTFQDFAAWAAQPPFFAGRRGLLAAAWILPIVTLTLVIAQLSGAIPVPLWLLVVGISYTVTVVAGKEAEALAGAIADHQHVFDQYGRLFALVAAQDFSDPALRRMQARLGAGGISAATQMRRLERIMPVVQLRRWPFFILIQVFTMALFHMIWLLDRWRAIAGAHVGDWLAALGEMEALAALATLAHDHPAWAFPTFAMGGTPEVVARDLAHPLLPPATCVGNDVRIGPPGSFVLVTGSNMSGKSTLLRAVGVNLVLAGMGGPVAAAELRLSPVQIATSIRISDSLEQGVSYFMAELRQLKGVLDQAQSAHDTGGPALLFLLDEILHGTNTTERQIAARHIITHLLNLGALGMVSTHDLTLANTPDLAARAQMVHFTESFARENGQPVMHFDYHLPRVSQPRPTR